MKQVEGESASVADIVEFLFQKVTPPESERPHRKWNSDRYTTKELANYISAHEREVSPQFVHKIRHGEAPRVEASYLRAIAEFFGVGLGMFAKGQAKASLLENYQLQRDLHSLLTGGKVDMSAVRKAINDLAAAESIGVPTTSPQVPVASPTPCSSRPPTPLFQEAQGQRGD